ncbi:beta-D-glucosyl crocetin beta-1,6-glucosyltransferase-like [Primulina huaijiensis]|uniref:beta-D-glucosyl crocetin beta-1,6-glucosyltransferase-like n=1 Tax=Primulina huaijiensis TaxID=1492673 RepID=UPI003CC79867
MAAKEEGFKVLMFPFLAHGHISPFLQLAKQFSARNLHVYICSTPVNLSSIERKIPEKQCSHIHLVELHLPSSPELPPHFHTTNGLPPYLQPTLEKLLVLSRPNFSNLLTTLRPDLLIYDIMQPWAGSEASLLKIPSVSFIIFGAASVSYLSHLGLKRGVEFPFPTICLTDFELSMAIKTVESALDDRKDRIDSENKVSIRLINSSRAMEGKYMDYLSKLMDCEILPTGALIYQDPSDTGDIEQDDDEIMKWLERNDVCSSVLVSFGSEYFLKREDIEEIAHGLELSNVNFIWLLRFPKGEETKIADALPERFLQRVGEKGVIVEKWAPQAKILSSSKIGGFVSHCGWNSLMESISFRVPIIGMPMQLDQPLNAKLVEELGVGVEVLRDGNGRFRRGQISSVIKDVVFGNEGEKLRRQIEGQRTHIRSTSREEIHGVMQKLAELCGKNSFDVKI